MFGVGHYPVHIENDCPYHHFYTILLSERLPERHTPVVSKVQVVNSFNGSDVNTTGSANDRAHLCEQKAEPFSDSAFYLMDIMGLSRLE